eukprot:984724_1
MRIYDLKKKLNDLEGLPCEFFFLTFAGKALRDSSRIKDVLKDGYLVRLMMGLEGGALEMHHLYILKSNTGKYSTGRLYIDWKEIGNKYNIEMMNFLKGQWKNATRHHWNAIIHENLPLLNSVIKNRDRNKNLKYVPKYRKQKKKNSKVSDDETDDEETDIDDETDSDHDDDDSDMAARPLQRPNDIANGGMCVADDANGGSSDGSGVRSEASSGDEDIPIARRLRYCSDRVKQAPTPYLKRNFDKDGAYEFL